jgi:hypothetical protein
MRYLSTVAAVALSAGLAGAADNGQKWGTIKGRVVYNGKQRPALVKVEITKDKAHCLSAGW